MAEMLAARGERQGVAAPPNDRSADVAQRLIEAARAFLGTPFVHQGRTLGVGVDCVGLLEGAARAAGIALPEVRADYARTPDGELERELERYCTRVFDLALRRGDVLLLRIYSTRPRHLALVTDPAPVRIIHAYQGAERVAEHQLTAWWRARIHSRWRFAELLR